MYCHIEAEVVLGNYFLLHKEMLSFGRLREIEEALQEAFSDDVLVDISTLSLGAVIEQYPKMFQWEGNSIVCGTDDRLTEQFVDTVFCQGLEAEVRGKVRNTIRELKSLSC